VAIGQGFKGDTKRVGPKGAQQKSGSGVKSRGHREVEKGTKRKRKGQFRAADLHQQSYIFNKGEVSFITIYELRGSTIQKKGVAHAVLASKGSRGPGGVF